MSSSTEAPEIFFRGTGGNECEAFVVAVRDFAFAKGLQRDRDWMLDFATTRLRGRALRWHARLDLAIREDWDLFVQALFDEYPQVEEPNRSEIATPLWSATNFSPSPSAITLPQNPEPNPSSAPEGLPLVPVVSRTLSGHESSHIPHPSNQPTYLPRRYDPSSEEQQIGLLRIVNDRGTGIPQYIWWGYTVAMVNQGHNQRYGRPTATTVNRHEALVVSFLPASLPHPIGCLNSRGDLRSLGFWWIAKPGQSVEHYDLHAFTSCCADGGDGYVSKIWNVLEDGTLKTTISCFSQNGDGGYNETRITTTDVHVDTSGGLIRFVKPGAPLEQDKPQGSPMHPFVRARIVFEPL